MGISYEHAKYLCNSVLFENHNPKILTLGVQEVFFDDNWLKILVQSHLPKARVVAALDKIHEYKNSDKTFNYGPRKGKTLNAKYVLDVIANADIVSIDSSDFESADIIFDLNNKCSEKSLLNNFDIVFDLGTSEHIFDTKSVLCNIHSFLKIKGMVLHIVPANNCVDHGFYQFSPTLLNDYYLENKYLKIDLNLSLEPDGSDFAPCFLHPYSPGSLMDFTQGGLPNGKYFSIGIFQKTSKSTSGIAPIQRAYKKIWAQAATQITHDEIPKDL